MKGLTVLIDGDILAYRCGFAAEKKHYTLKYRCDGTDFETRFVGKKAMNEFLKEQADGIDEYEWGSELVVEPLSYCLSTVKHMISNIKKACNAKACIIFLSDKDNYRNDIATIAKYKGNRDQTRKPIHHAEIMKYLDEHHDAVTRAGMEADDLLADTQVTYNAAGQDTAIASIDKDLLQIEGKHYDFVKEKFMLITPDTALRNLYEQMLKGDRTDNIPGIAGVGDVIAKKMLADYKTKEDMYEVVYEAWEDYLLGENPPEWMDEYDEDTKTIRYHDWEGNKEYMLMDDLLNELKKLLTVGVPQGDIDDDIC